jgi:hypothetical protein
LRDRDEAILGVGVGLTRPKSENDRAVARNAWSNKQKQTN